MFRRLRFILNVIPYAAAASVVGVSVYVFRGEKVANRAVDSFMDLLKDIGFAVPEKPE